MSKLSKKILEKVKKSRISHKAKWKFIAKRILIWTALFVSIILLALSISMIIHQLNHVEPMFKEEFQRREFMPMFKLVPYFWILISGLLLTFTYFEFRKTKTGYRHRPSIIIGISILIAMILGFTLFSFKMSQHMEDQFQRNPFYQKMHFMHQMKRIK